MTNDICQIERSKKLFEKAAGNVMRRLNNHRLGHSYSQLTKVKSSYLILDCYIIWWIIIVRPDMRAVVGRATDSLMKMVDISQLVGIMKFVFMTKERVFVQTSASHRMALLPSINWTHTKCLHALSVSASRWGCLYEIDVEITVIWMIKGELSKSSSSRLSASENITRADQICLIQQLISCWFNNSIQSPELLFIL